MKKNYFIIILLILILPNQDLVANSNNKNNNINQTSHKGEVERDERFILFDNGTIVDKVLNLMWAGKDNGSQISWDSAAKYCEKYSLAGYTDWRMPTLQELETLHTNNFQNLKPTTDNCSGSFFIHRYFHITCCCLWAKEKNGRKAAFPYSTNERFWHHQTATTGNRVLPVRNILN
jgi:hypothetical protein